MFPGAGGSCTAHPLGSGQATGGDRFDEASADVTAVLKYGRRVRAFFENAIGSLQNPMTEAQLAAKFQGTS